MHVFAYRTLGTYLSLAELSTLLQLLTPTSPEHLLHLPISSGLIYIVRSCAHLQVQSSKDSAYELRLWT